MVWITGAAFSEELPPFVVNPDIGSSFPAESRALAVIGISAIHNRDDVVHPWHFVTRTDIFLYNVVNLRF